MSARDLVDVRPDHIPPAFRAVESETLSVLAFNRDYDCEHISIVFSDTF